MPERVPIVLSDLIGYSAGLLDNSGNEADSKRLGTIENPPRKRHVECVAETDHFRETDRPTPRTEQSERYSRLSERGSLGGDPNVTGQRQFDATTASSTVDSRDDDRVTAFDRIGCPLPAANKRLGIATVGERRN